MADEALLKKQLVIYNKRHRNSKNKWITEDIVNNIFKTYGINKKVKNIENYKTAFIHDNYKNPSDEQLIAEMPLNSHEMDNTDYKKTIPFQSKSYERLEFLGDRILETIVCDYIFHRYYNENDGFLSDLKTRIVRTDTLALFSKILSFNEYIILSKRYENTRNDNNLLEDVFEAFIGAIYDDYGCGGEAYDIIKSLIFKLIETNLNMGQLVRTNDNYKKQLMEYFHSKYKIEPSYVKITTYGPTYDRKFKAGVLNIDGHIITTGEGSTIKEAEQMAAKEALKFYGIEPYDNSMELDKHTYNV